jgi:hypothetical protein
VRSDSGLTDQKGESMYGKFCDQRLSINVPIELSAHSRAAVKSNMTTIAALGRAAPLDKLRRGGFAAKP